MLTIENTDELMGSEAEEVEPYIPVHGFEMVMKENGNMKTVRTNSYAALLCRRDGSSVKAVRYDGYTSKYDLYKVIAADFPDWKLKGVYKLYKQDFLEEEAD